MPDLFQLFYNEINTKSKSSNGSWDLEKVLSLFELDTNACFLDIGCYDGSKTATIAQRIGTKNIYGVDILSNILNEAQQRGIQTEAIDLNKGNILPYPDNFFNVIFVSEIIEHIFSPDFLLKEIRRLLCPNGYAIITTPNLASWRNRIALLFGWQPFSTEVSTKYIVGNPRSHKGNPVGHIRIFTQSALTELIEKYGMSIEWSGGLINRGHRSGLTIVTGLIDDIVALILPSLCDGLIVKVRKSMS